MVTPFPNETMLGTRSRLAHAIPPDRGAAHLLPMARRVRLRLAPKRAGPEGRDGFDPKCQFHGSTSLGQFDRSSLGQFDRSTRIGLTSRVAPQNDGGRVAPPVLDQPVAAGAAALPRGAGAGAL